MPSITVPPQEVTVRARHVLVAAAAAVFALAGCGSSEDTSAPADPSKLDESATFACTDFAKGYKAAQTKDARVELANKVNKWAASSKTNRITDAGAALGRGADGTVAAWTTAADSFAVACTDAGWTADKAK